MTKTGDRIADLRKEKDLTQDELAKRLNVARSTIANYEKGTRLPKKDSMLKLAKVFDVDREYLEGLTDISRKGEVSPQQLYKKGYKQGEKEAKDKLMTRLLQRTIPVFSCISCGTGVWVDEYPEDRMTVPETFVSAGADYFANPAEGDSMNPIIKEGDFLIFEKSDVIESGQIGSFSLNGEYYCKRFRRLPDGTFILLSENPAYEPIAVGKDDDFRVLGIYRMKLSKEQ